MPRNGSGTYSLPAGNPVVTGTIISSTWANTTLQDIATALTQSQAADGQTPVTGDIDMNNNHHTDVSDATEINEYGVVHQIQEQAYTWCGTAGGTANAIVLTPMFPIVAYTAGQSFQFIVSANNGGAVTVAVSGLAVKAVTKQGAVALNSGDLVEDAVVEITYDGTQFQVDLVTAGSATFTNVTVTNNLAVGTNLSVGGVIEAGTVNADDATIGNNLEVGNNLHVINDAQFDGDLFLGDDNILDLIAAAGSAQGGFSSSGLVARNNTGTPNTQLDMTASAIVVLNPTTSKSTYLAAPAAKTNNVSTAGPIAGGRDQAGAFSASSWIHFYYIYNSTTDTLSSISSTIPPPVGPTLPSGYDSWCYVGPVRFSGGSALEAIYISGDFAYRQVVTNGVAVNGGTQSAETAVDIQALVPPNAPEIELNALIATAGGGGAANEWALQIGFISGVTFQILSASVNASVSTGTRSYLSTPMPNLGQNLYYQVDLIAGSTGAGSAFIYVVGYSIPNNG